MPDSPERLPNPLNKWIGKTLAATPRLEFYQNNALPRCLSAGTRLEPQGELSSRPGPMAQKRASEIPLEPQQKIIFQYMTEHYTSWPQYLSRTWTAKFLSRRQSSKHTGPSAWNRSNSLNRGERNGSGFWHWLSVGAPWANARITAQRPLSLVLRKSPAGRRITSPSLKGECAFGWYSLACFPLDVVHK